MTLKAVPKKIMTRATNFSVKEVLLKKKTLKNDEFNVAAFTIFFGSLVNVTTIGRPKRIFPLRSLLPAWREKFDE